MQGFSVKPEQVIGLGGKIRGGARGIRTDLDRLESEVGKLRSAWGGEAQAAYDQAQLKWNRSLEELQQLLEQIATKTEQMSGGYTSGDNQSAKRFSV
ncbi:WXG100 family type VII secretion target [Agromyces larvae]|uniref:ESAT-6-like protein n=1 Tax=Agromyces larvae TaxID=2929802 RepID=A0ABY4C5B7_9MICO|nr:WXG100 family type VII secretion target [Agromyces larvae]UOE43945.1 WXG100 family type VII secretion target [Agromyces larvae]